MEVIGSYKRNKSNQQLQEGIQNRALLLLWLLLPNEPPHYHTAKKGYQQVARLYLPSADRREKERFLSGSHKTQTTLVALSHFSGAPFPSLLLNTHTQFPTKCCCFSFYLSTVINQRQSDWHSPLCLCVCGQSLIHLRPISGYALYLAQGGPVITLLTTVMCGAREPLELPLLGWVSEVKGF